MSDLRGFKRVGLGYERQGFGGRTWRICRFRGGFRILLEGLEGARELLDDFAVQLGDAFVISELWDEQLEEGYRKGDVTLYGNHRAMMAEGLHGPQCICGGCHKRRAATELARLSRTSRPLSLGVEDGGAGGGSGSVPGRGSPGGSSTRKGT